MKLSDYVVQFLVEHGIPDIFLVSGGGIMHLVDSVGRNPDIHYVCNYHEQACAIAAESYARAKNHVGACLVTTGPGSTNALSGIARAWVDSIPVIVISGQVRRQIIADYSQLRQLGPQEINIIDMARPVTKYATTILDPERIGEELAKAYDIALSGRPGPVWLNIPLDVQAAEIAPRPSPFASRLSPLASPSDADVAAVLSLLRSSRRPVLICGNAIHLARAERTLEEFLDRFRIPVLLTHNGMDLLPEDHPCYMGRFGPGGQRRANFCLQNSDLLLSLGTSLSVASIGFNFAGFAPRAKKAAVNIDPAELTKPTVRLDLAIAAEVKAFMEAMLAHSSGVYRPPQRWLDACVEWKQRYPLVNPDQFNDREHVNSYVFMDTLSDLLSPTDIILTGNALDSASAYQALMVKRGQRSYTNANYGAMGWDLPAAVGAAVAAPDRRVVLVTGDGSFQFNVQELLTIGHNRLNIKIFVLNNRGYESIRATHASFFGRITAADPDTGVANPDYRLLAAAHGLEYARAATNGDIAGIAGRVLDSDGPVLCELNISHDQPRSPKATSFRRPDGTIESKPLEDMWPFLPTEEIWHNMHMFDDDDAQTKDGR